MLFRRLADSRYFEIRKINLRLQYAAGLTRVNLRSTCALPFPRHRGIAARNPHRNPTVIYFVPQALVARRYG